MWSGAEQSFSVLIHKPVENDMGEKSLFVERYGSAVCLIYKSNYVAEEMDAKWHCIKPCSAKSCNNGNESAIQFTYIYVWCTVY